MQGGTDSTYKPLIIDLRDSSPFQPFQPSASPQAHAALNTPLPQLSDKGPAESIRMHLPKLPVLWQDKAHTPLHPRVRKLSHSLCMLYVSPTETDTVLVWCGGGI